MLLEEETRLRERIKSILFGTEQEPDPLKVREAEDQVLALLREYVRAPKEQRKAVYARGEKKILHALRT